MKHRTAFSLIELLVVVTIIVVLLALLTPALDRAVYEAELAVCGSHLHVVGVAVTTYALDSRRRYPHRAGVHLETNTVSTGGTFLAPTSWHPHKLYNGGTDPLYDDRVRLRQYMGLNAALNDPLAPRADFEFSQGSHTYATYYLWFGYKFAGQKGMDRLGDRFTWGEGGQTSSFDLLGGDQDDVRYADTISATFASHPDPSGVLHSESYQNAGSPKSVVARWAAQGAAQRSPIDMQFVWAGGDVGRLDAVKVDEDERMVKVPVFNGATHTLTQWTHLPAR